MGASPSSALRGSETPRVFSKPLRPLTRRTSAGFEACDFAQDVLGIDLYPWQRWLLVHALELDDQRKFRFRTVVVLVARQNGKTTLVQVLALWRLFVDAAGLVIGTAQNLDVAEEAWQGAVDMAEGVPELKAEIENVDRTNGKKALRLTTGERYKVSAASRRGGRGLSGDLVILDELREHQKWDAWGAVTKTTMARERPQIWCLSNAGDDTSVVLHHLREAAMRSLDGSGDDSLGLFEWSAPPSCDILDRSGWVQANPALGYSITERALMSSVGTDPEEVFRTENLCQWVDSLTKPVINPAVWAQLADVQASRPSPCAFAVDVTPDRSRSSIAVAGRRPDGLLQVELVAAEPGTAWVVDRLTDLVQRWAPLGIALDAGGPAGTLVPALEAAALPVDALSARDMAQAAGFLFDTCEKQGLRHSSQPDLDVALAAAKPRDVGDGLWKLSRKSSVADISPLVAVTAALWEFNKQPVVQAGLSFLNDEPPVARMTGGTRILGASTEEWA